MPPLKLENGLKSYFLRSLALPPMLPNRGNVSLESRIVSIRPRIGRRGAARRSAQRGGEHLKARLVWQERFRMQIEPKSSSSAADSLAVITIFGSKCSKVGMMQLRL